jgi:hypothetical protein
MDFNEKLIIFISTHFSFLIFAGSELCLGSASASAHSALGSSSTLVPVYDSLGA